MKFIRNKKLILFLIFLGVFSFGSAVLALEIDWPDSPVGTPLTKDSTLTDLVKYLYEWGIALGGLVVFIVLIIAGFQYLISVGDPTMMKEAMDRIKAAFLGLVLLLGSWLILHTINPELTTFPPLVLDLARALPLCDDDKDCPENYKCFKTEEQKKRGEKGICIPKITKPKPEPCKYAELYSDTDYRGESKRIEMGETLRTAGLGWEPKSAKAFKAENVEGGTCLLQLFGGVLPGRCRDRINEPPLPQRDLTKVIDRPIMCVRLISYE